MTINQIDVSGFGARQHHVDFGHHSMSNDSAWVRAAILPHLSRNYINFKSISVDLIMKPLQSQSEMDPRDAIHQNVSDILAALIEPADIQLDMISHFFKVILTGHKVQEESPRRFHKLTLDFDGYEYGTEVSAEGTSGSVIISNPGNILSPVRLTITTPSAMQHVVINGACVDPRTGEDLPIVLETTKAGVPIVLDGANGLFTEGGVLKGDINIKTPPGVTKGIHTISCAETAPGATIEARVLPLYM